MEVDITYFTLMTETVQLGWRSITLLTPLKSTISYILYWCSSWFLSLSHIFAVSVVRIGLLLF